MRRSIFIAASAVLVAAGFSAPAGAAVEGSAAVCRVYAGSVTADGGHRGAASSSTPGGTTAGVFEAGKVRLASTFTVNPNVAGADLSGWVLQGDSLYLRNYSITTDGLIDPGGPNELQRIGGGWANFTALEVSQYAVGHANGTATVIQGLGKVDGTFDDPVYHRWGAVPALDPLNGE